MLLIWQTTVLLANAALAKEIVGSACSIAHNRLDADTKEFITDCDSFGCELLDSR